MRIRGWIGLATLSFTACATGAAAFGGSARHALLDRLYFGRAIGDTGQVSDSAWAAFAREIITPRFPDGMTAWRARGQWRSGSGTIVHEPTVVLEIVHPANDSAEVAVREIVAEYKRRFRQEAVLRVTSDVRVTF